MLIRCWDYVGPDGTEAGNGTRNSEAGYVSRISVEKEGIYKS